MSSYCVLRKYIISFIHKYKIIVVILVLGITIFLIQSVYTYHLSPSFITQKTIPYSTFDAIPKTLVNAIITVEDKRFRIHPGIDPIALARATYQTLIRDNTQGGSTIDQQIVKLTDAQFHRSRQRKIYEMRQAINLQFHYSKQEILLAYINNIPFSHGIVGRNAACNIYFHKGCEFLDDTEISYLFSVAQLGINPYKDSNQAIIISRAKVICDVLSSKGITSTCDGLTTHTSNTTSADTGTGQDNTQQIMPVVTLYEYENEVDPKIQRTLDQQANILQSSFSLEQYTRVQNILKATQQHRIQYNAQNCCVVALDEHGGIITMNSCSARNDPMAGKVNTCTEPRQVGSAIKPFLYTYAFQQLGLTSNDTIVDEPVSFDLGDGSIYSPKNFDLTYRGKVTYAYALGNSLNVPAIKTLNVVGVNQFLEFLKKQLDKYATGLNNNDKDAENVGLSLALGTYEMSPYAFTHLRRMFLKATPPQGFEKQAKEVVDILSDPNNKIAAFGQDNFLTLPGRAVKTGTSRKFIDGRVCGANNDKGITLCIWMGNIDNQAMKGPSSEVGSYMWNIIAKGF